MVIQRQSLRIRRTVYLAVKLDLVAVLTARGMLGMRTRKKDAEVHTCVTNYVFQFENQILHLVICQKTEFGCCPNNKTVATGPDFEGCGVIDHKDCRMSYFKCCPDGSSPGKLIYEQKITVILIQYSYTPSFGPEL